MTKDRIVTPNLVEEDRIFDLTLRPQTLTEFIGQEKIKENLKIFIEAAKGRQQPLEHVLFSGPPGIGKTTLGHIIAHEMGANIKAISGPVIEKPGDICSILTNLSDYDILFIDEIHRINRIVEEVLYPVMEDYVLDVILGKGPQAKTLRLDLPKFTLAGATTRPGLLSSPLRDRFGVSFRLNYYTKDDIEKIVRRSAGILGISLDDASIKELAKRSRFTPRVANRLLKRIRDYSQVKTKGIINQEITSRALDLLEIDELGLDELDRNILKVMIEKFDGGPVGIKAISSTVSEEKDTLEEVYEPYLLQIGLLARTPRGRVVTKLGYEHLGMKYPKKLQEELRF